MFKQKPFIFSLVILIILFTLHIIGSAYSLYWVYPWYDVLVHVFGGLWIGLIILWLFSCLGQINSLKDYKLKAFLMAFLSAILIGVIWELLENMSQIVSVDAPNYALNTVTDILSDAMGGILAYVYFIKRKKIVSDHTNILHPFYDKSGAVRI